MDSYEIFYHGFLLDILMHLDRYKVKSNREEGNERYDMSIVSVVRRKIWLLLNSKRWADITSLSVVQKRLCKNLG